MAEQDKQYQPLPNKEAIVSFNGKTLLTSESYLDVKAYQHALSFTVAKMMDEDLLADTRGLIQSAMETGTDFHEFKKQLLPQLMSKGWLGLDPSITKDTDMAAWLKQNKFISNRLRTIFHTNLHTSYAAGQWSRIQQTKEFLPYLQYMPSLATHKRLEHKRYYNLVRPVSDPLWQSIMPPNGYGCLCWVKQLTKRQAEKIGISDEAPLTMVDYTNPKTGETYPVPEGVEPSFAHNFVRKTDTKQNITDAVKVKTPAAKTSNTAMQDTQLQLNQLANILKIAVEKHGTDFSSQLVQLLSIEMIKYFEQTGSEATIDYNFLNQIISNIAPAT